MRVRVQTVKATTVEGGTGRSVYLVCTVEPLYKGHLWNEARDHYRGVAFIEGCIWYGK